MNEVIKQLMYGQIIKIEGSALIWCLQAVEIVHADCMRAIV